jgi:hypothetical protein
MALFVIFSPHVLSNGWIVVMFVKIINLTGIRFEFFTNILQDTYDKRYMLLQYICECTASYSMKQTKEESIET